MTIKKENHAFRGFLQSGDGVITEVVEADKKSIRFRTEFRLSNPIVERLRHDPGNIVFSERRSGNFRRSITLPEPVIEGGMKTKIENGVLTIVIPKYRTPGS